MSGDNDEHVVEEPRMTAQPARESADLTPDEAVAVASALAEREDADAVVEWVYEPDAAHVGASVPGIPPRNLTVRDRRTRGLTDEQMSEYPHLYRRAGKE